VTGQRRLVAVIGLSVAALVVSATVRGRAQVAENAGDPTGIAIPYPLVHLHHSNDVDLEGTTGYLRAKDSYLLYQLGRDLVNRQFELKHGVLGRSGELSVPLYVGMAGVTQNTVSVHGGSPRFARDHAVSCGMCHSSVYREPSAGQTIGSTGGLGRNTSHFYGAGLIEMLGEQVTKMVLNEYDTNRNGFIDRAESRGPKPVRIKPIAGSTRVIDYGDLSPGPDGVPRLNNVFRLWYVDGAGALIPDAVSLADTRVAGFGLAMQPFGWGRGRTMNGGRLVSQGGEAATLREFYTTAADFHMGLQAHDPTQQGAVTRVSGFGGIAHVSLSGAQQYDFGGSVDLGAKQTPTGVSLDDPDGDGHPSELTEGDVDAVEFFLLHMPAPARMTGLSDPGAKLLRDIGCTRCHAESWQLEARDAVKGFTGDRRLFRFETHVVEEGDTPAVAGRLTPTRAVRTATGGAPMPAGEAYLVEAIYTDFKHWDIGPEFHERRFDGSLQKAHRTAPLWGVGNTGPYGHSGRFRDLRTVILAHGGAALASRQAFAALSEPQRDQVVKYLSGLVLFQTDEIAADIDGDGRVDDHYKVGGIDVGYERFNAAFLFKAPPKFSVVGALVHPTGRDLPAMTIANIPETYGLRLPYRIDANGDGFPDVLGNIPITNRSTRSTERR
jgi:Di-haem oxidoreductase, putative peroxidase